MADNLESGKCRRVFAISTLCVTLILIGSAIFLHIRERKEQGNTGSQLANGVAAAPVDTEMPGTPWVPSNKQMPAINDDDDDYYYYTSNYKNNDFDMRAFNELSDDDDDDDDDDYYSDNKNNENFYGENGNQNQNVKENANKDDVYHQSDEVKDVKATTITWKSPSNDDSMVALSETKAAGNDFSDRKQKEEQLLSCSPTNNNNNNSNKELPSPSFLSELCLQCICETSTECLPAECSSGPCGLFRISRPYWIDAGRPRLQGADDSDLVDDNVAYSQCVNNHFCAARTVNEFMRKYSRDCNQDGVIDCKDYVAIHILGPRGCNREIMSAIFSLRLATCLSKFT